MKCKFYIQIVLQFRIKNHTPLDRLLNWNGFWSRIYFLTIFCKFQWIPHMFPGPDEVLHNLAERTAGRLATSVRLLNFNPNFQVFGLLASSRFSISSMGVQVSGSGISALATGHWDWRTTATTECAKEVTDTWEGIIQRVFRHFTVRSGLFIVLDVIVWAAGTNGRATDAVTINLRLL